MAGMAVLCFFSGRCRDEAGHFAFGAKLRAEPRQSWLRLDKEQSAKGKERTGDNENQRDYETEEGIRAQRKSKGRSKEQGQKCHKT